jgi:hypothetical protein
MGNGGILEPYKGILVSLIVKQIMSYLAIHAPWVLLPGLKQLINGLSELFVRFVINNTILGINIAYIIVETTIDLRQFKQALEEYKRLQESGASKEKTDDKEKEIIKIGFDIIDLNRKRL